MYEWELWSGGKRIFEIRSSTPEPIRKNARLTAISPFVTHNLYLASTNINLGKENKTELLLLKWVYEKTYMSWKL